MKIELVSGCINDSFTADGKEFNSMNEMELLIILLKVANKLSKKTDYSASQKADLQSAIARLIEIAPDTYTVSDTCECCGDYTETWIMEV